MDKMMTDLREDYSLLLEENERLRLEHETEPVIVMIPLDQESQSMIPPRSSSAVELLPHVLNRGSPSADPQEELIKLRTENKVLVAYLIKTGGDAVKLKEEYSLF